MNIMFNLFALYNETAKDDTYHKAIEGIIRNIDQIENASIFDLADLCLVSKATIERLIRMMGYHSLPQFRHDISLVHRKYTYYNRVLPSELCQNDDQMFKAYFSTIRDIVDKLESQADMAEIHRVADALDQAHRVCFYTGGRSYAENALQVNLAMAGKDTIILTRYADQLEDARSLDKDSLVIVFTIDFHIALDMMPVISEAAERGAKVVLVTTNEVSQYRQFADFNIVSKFTDTMISDYGMQMNMDLISMVYRKKYIDQVT
jgi:DNA-binding MurR/RpiR family transcriptional regulator